MNKNRSFEAKCCVSKIKFYQKQNNMPTKGGGEEFRSNYL